MGHSGEKVKPELLGIQGLQEFFRGMLPTSPLERLNGIQEVSGSIPLISTTRNRKPVSRKVSGLSLYLCPFRRRNFLDDSFGQNP